MSVIRHITLPAGFQAAGVKCGIKASGREDLAIVAGEAPCSVALVTTRNQVVGAPVLWCRQIMPRGYGKARGIVINSGCSNVCTGAAGLKDAKTMAALTARKLGCTVEEVLVASTGVIGHRLPMDKVRRGIADAALQLATHHDERALAAIMTTDTRPKSAVVQSHAGRTPFTVAGMAKGSGMIAPSLATMIGVITTDLAVAPAALHKALKAAVAGSFNAVTVDSDTSTSDTVAVFASGAAGNKSVTTGSPAYRAFAAVLKEVCDALAYAIAADGEGATKVIRVAVRGARNDADATIAAKAVADSPLFKCAVHGGDPNWGRIVAALGKSAAKIVPEKLSVKIGGVTVFARGGGRKCDLKAVEQHLAETEVEVVCDLGLGRGGFTALTCDLSREYITINADYHT